MNAAAAAAASTAATAPPLALYLHFPWCVRKCPYCDFNSFTLHGELAEGDYLAALASDVLGQAAAVGDREIVSIFMGGGTPSLFSPAGIGRLLERISETLRFAPGMETTLEANPGTIERGRFEDYRAAGINRVSLGAQSFDAAQLRQLGRIHGPDEIRRSADELHAAGLDNFNLDLMFALPGQTLAEALSDLESALALAPAHLSHYQLTLEPGTVFAGRPPTLPDDDVAWSMQQHCMERLAASGFEQYEVSAHARAGRRCRHNLNYWRFGDYLGAGAGAHGKLTDPASGRITRSRRPREPRRYLASAGDPPVSERLDSRDLPFEFALNAFRLNEGFTLELFEQRTGVRRERLHALLDGLARKGLVESPEGERWSASELGRRFLNDVIEAFLPTSSGREPVRSGAATPSLSTSGRQLSQI